MFVGYSKIHLGFVLCFPQNRKFLLYIKHMHLFPRNVGFRFFRIMVSKRFVVEDCVKTFMNTYLDQYSTGSSAVVDFDVDLPSNFKIEYETLITQSTNNSCFVSIGETSSKAVLAGKVGSTNSIWKVYARNSSDLITNGSSIPISNDWIPITLTFDGTTFKFNNDISVTNFNGVSLTKLVRISSWKERTSSGQIRNIKIKPL